MAKTLQLKFNTVAGKNVLLTVDNPRSNLTAPEVVAAMQEIITSAVFGKDGFPLSEAVSAKIIERNATEIV